MNKFCQSTNKVVYTSPFCNTLLTPLFILFIRLQNAFSIDKSYKHKVNKTTPQRALRMDWLICG